MAADPLSDALALVDARCVVSGAFSAEGAWALRFSREARLKITAVVRGSCRLTVDGVVEPVELRAGDVAVMNGPSSLVLATDPSLEPADANALWAESAGAVVRLGDGDEVACLGAHVELSRGGDDLLLAALPAVTRIQARTDEAPVLHWLLDRLFVEMTEGRPGGEFAIHQHAQLLLVEVLRALLPYAPAFPPGWLRALADDRLAPALRLMHAEPGRSWHLEELAHVSAMSRTSFAAHFKTVAGVPPLTYLHQWRMRIAERALRDGDTPIVMLAPALGYTSESAFSTAFKRTVGVAPRHYRDAARAEVRRAQMAPPLA
jgi:AraC-like DNA-binding protein